LVASLETEEPRNFRELDLPIRLRLSVVEDIFDCRD
jgi:hypothetical protein